MEFLNFGSMCLLEVSLRKVVKRSKKHHVLLNLRFFLWNPKDSVVKKEIKNMKRVVTSLKEAVFSSASAATASSIPIPQNARGE